MTIIDKILVSFDSETDIEVESGVRILSNIIVFSMALALIAAFVLSATSVWPFLNIIILIVTCILSLLLIKARKFYIAGSVFLIGAVFPSLLSPFSFGSYHYFETYYITTYSMLFLLTVSSFSTNRFHSWLVVSISIITLAALYVLREVPQAETFITADIDVYIICTGFMLIAGFLNSLVIDVRRNNFQQIREEARVSALRAEELEQKVNQRTKDLSDSNIQLKRTMVELISTRDQLVKSEKAAATARIVTGIAHELNTPLGVTVNGMSYLQKSCETLRKTIDKKDVKKSELTSSFDNMKDSLDLVVGNVNRMAELIQKFKAVAVEQSDIKSTRFDPYDTLLTLSKTYSEILKTTNAKISVKYENDEAVAEPLQIKGYHDSFTQIFTHLIDNSLQHGLADKTVEGVITIIISISTDVIEFEYSDNGKAIDPEAQKKMYDAFYTTKRGDGHVGLGLYLVYRLVHDKLNGSVDYSGDENSSVFKIKFPRVIKDN
jgi:signal transduction histidine kinase